MPVTISKLLLVAFATLVIYAALPRRWQNYWLLIVSYIYYASWTWRFPVILLLLTVINYILGQELQRGEQRRRLLLWLIISLNVLSLLLFKYPGFLTNHLPNSALAALRIFDLDINVMDILLPVGLSFRVMELISYQVDIYNKRLEASTDLVDFALYIAYFPKLLAGPIERARTFLPQLAQDRRIDKEAVARSLTLIVIGLVRKVVIADPLTVLVPPEVFDNPAAFTAPELIIRLLTYAFALYNDFAGYTNIMRGISGLFGIELSVNFQQPYFSRNFTEFWNRWHISLSHWLRDYIYFPVSRKLRQIAPEPHHILNIVVPPLITMLVSAAWHGIGPMMFVWGTLHGIYQIIWRLPSLRWAILPPDKQPWWRQNLSRLVVFILVVLAWIPFRTFTSATIDYWRGLLIWSGTTALDVRPFILIIPSLVLDWIQYRTQDEVIFIKWPQLAKAAALTLAILSIFLILQAEQVGTEFIYQGF